MDYFLRRHTFSQTIAVYGANILLSFHFALVIYINSTYLERFFDDKIIGVFYAVGSLVSIGIFLLIPRIIERIGIFSATLICILLEFAAIIAMGLSSTPYILALAFLVHTAVIAILFYILDVYLETVTRNEAITGSTRGIYLTLTNLTLIFAPLVVGMFVNLYGYEIIYLISALFLIPLTFLAHEWLKPIHMSQHIFVRPHIKKDMATIYHNTALRYPFIAQIVLQFFFAFAVIYIPIYLITQIGFTWKILGPLFTIMLLPYVLFELPVGRLADTRYGEKEFMIGGFLLTALSMILSVFLQTPEIILWSLVLFLSRVGASFSEITSETSFFRHVDGTNKGAIAIFRITRPLSYILATCVGALTLTFFSFNTLFIIIALILIWGALMILPMKDSR